MTFSLIVAMIGIAAGTAGFIEAVRYAVGPRGFRSDPDDAGPQLSITLDGSPVDLRTVANADETNGWVDVYPTTSRPDGVILLVVTPDAAEGRESPRPVRKSGRVRITHQPAYT